jgi:hypothetical protein
MNNRVRKQMERASRVATFVRERRAELGSYQDPLTRLDQRVARATEVAQRETTARRAVTAAIAERNAVGGTIQSDLRLLARLARAARLESVTVPIVIQFPGPRRNQTQFLTGARGAIDTAREYTSILQLYGMPAGLLDTVSAQLDRFEHLMHDRDGLAQAAVATTRELDLAATDLLQIATQWDGLIIHHYREDAVTLRAWEMAADMRTSRRKPPPPLADDIAA